jgi:hypothetical protein
MAIPGTGQQQQPQVQQPQVQQQQLQPGMNPQQLQGAMQNNNQFYAQQGQQPNGGQLPQMPGGAPGQQLTQMQPAAMPQMQQQPQAYLPPGAAQAQGAPPDVNPAAMNLAPLPQMNATGQQQPYPGQQPQQPQQQADCAGVMTSTGNPVPDQQQAITPPDAPATDPNATLESASGKKEKEEKAPKAPRRTKKLRREEMAIAAMQGLLPQIGASLGTTSYNAETAPTVVADAAVAMADALLAKLDGK